jgi:hypothetical protein
MNSHQHLKELTMSTIVIPNIEERQEVVDSTGLHVGTVDHVEGDMIKLTRRDSSDGKHHVIPASLICSVDTKVHLTKTFDELKELWTTD